MNIYQYKSKIMSFYAPTTPALSNLTSIFLFAYDLFSKNFQRTYTTDIPFAFLKRLLL